MGEVISLPSAAGAAAAAWAAVAGAARAAAAGAALEAAGRLASRPRRSSRSGALLELEVKVFLGEVEEGEAMLVHELDDAADFLEFHGAVRVGGSG
jgi:hypothetical protein